MPRALARRARSMASIDRSTLSGPLSAWISITPAKFAPGKFDCPCAGKASSRTRHSHPHLDGPRPTHKRSAGKTLLRRHRNFERILVLLLHRARCHSERSEESLCGCPTRRGLPGKGSAPLLTMSPRACRARGSFGDEVAGKASFGSKQAGRSRGKKAEGSAVF